MDGVSVSSKNADESFFDCLNGLNSIDKLENKDKLMARIIMQGK